MEYAVINTDGSFSHQVLEAGNVLWDDRNFCTPDALIRDGKAAQFGLVVLHDTPEPAFNPLTHIAVKDGFELSGEQWRQKWDVIALAQVDAPNFGVDTQVALRDGAELVDGVWSQRWKVELITQTVAPNNFDPVTHHAVKAGSEFANGQWQLKWQVEPVSESQLQVNLLVAEDRRVSDLWQGAYDYEFAEISGVAIGMLVLGVLQAKPKAVAVKDWSQSIWTEYYTRKANGTTNTDYSMLGACPHSIPELMAELGL